MAGHSGNPWVRDIQRAFRNSRIGNAENRGLDSAFAIETYVETYLDQRLVSRVIGGDYSAVFLTGNPGDGKTAFLVKLSDHLKRAGGMPKSRSAHGWEITLGDWRFVALYDASESQEGASSAVALDAALSPLGETRTHGDLKYTALIAVNDGRLREFLDGNSRYTRLAEQVTSASGGQGAFDQRVVLIDLKERSVVGSLESTTPEDTIFDRVLAAFLRDDQWVRCTGCPALGRCAARFNRDTLADPESGPQVRSRLRDLLRIIHLRRVRHVTLRDLRSLLSYIIAGTTTCEQVQTEVAGGDSPADATNRLYFAAAFNPLSETEDNLLDLGLCDPGEVALPRVERLLHYRRERPDALADLTMPFAQRSSEPLDSLSYETLGLRWYRLMKQRLYFEGDASLMQQQEPPVPAPSAMLPFRYYGHFDQAMRGALLRTLLRDELCQAISCSDGIVDERAQGKGLCILTNSNEDVQLTVFKRFAHSQFICSPAPAPASGLIEFLPNSLRFDHVGEEARLEIDLDLFEILMRLREGYQPGAPSQEPFLVDLRQFTNRLLTAPSSSLVLMEGGRQLYEVEQDAGDISISV
jgi:hypothetical protein